MTGPFSCLSKRGLIAMEFHCEGGYQASVLVFKATAIQHELCPLARNDCSI